MNMIHISTFKELDNKTFIFSYFLNKVFEICFNFSSKNSAPVLYGPYHMVVDIAHGSAVIN